VRRVEIYAGEWGTGGSLSVGEAFLLVLRRPIFDMFMFGNPEAIVRVFIFGVIPISFALIVHH